MREPPSLSLLSLPWLLLIGSCGSPPKLPTVDESQKRPVNTATAVELQACKSDLQNTRILATESERTAASTAAALRQLVATQQALSTLDVPPPPSRPNSVFTIRFDYASARVSVPAEMSAALIDEARQAPLIVLRGRTDGTSDVPIESRIARERAAAVRDYLVAAGVDATNIRATHQPAGDHAADNTRADGRAMNRRVEIEVYRDVPVQVGAAAAAVASHPVQP